MRHTRCIATVALLAVVTVCRAFVDDPKPNDYWRGQDLQMPAVQTEQVISAKDLQALTVAVKGVEELAFQDGNLHFTLKASQGVLSCGRTRSGEDGADALQVTRGAVLVMEIRQAGGASTLSACGWVDGRSSRAPTKSVELGGEGWQELRLGRISGTSRGGLPAEGFELTVEGKAGTRFELRAIKLVRRVCEGCVRREFVLPDGKIWRAVADVGGSPVGARGSRTVTYLNGKEVEAEIGGLYSTQPVDIRAYLRSGSNCVGMQGRRLNHTPFLYFQATVIMESGEVIRVVTLPDGSWKTHSRAEDGWNLPGFDDAHWSPLTSGYSGLGYVKNSLALPAYAGRIVLEKPAGSSLIFVEDEAAVIRARVPGGLRDRNPSLACLLEDAGPGGTRSRVRQATVEAYGEADGSLVYTLALGQLDPGVYTVGCDLMAGGEVLESRPREPFVVLQRRRQEPVAADDLRNGLDLHLEQAIDFTDPDAPHPWVEIASPRRRREGVQHIEQATVVQTNGLTYRETAARRGSCFSYRLNDFAHPGDFYLVELDYPDNADRLTEVDIVQKAEFWSKRQTSVAYQSGGRHFKTGETQTLSWIHVADPGVHSVDVLNHSRTSGAAARAIRFYWIKGGLPAVRSAHSRQYLIHTERQVYDDRACNGAGAVFDSRPAHQDYVYLARSRRVFEQDKPPVDALAEAQRNRPALSTIDRRVERLHHMLGVADRYAQYLRFVGQNHHIIGSYQYNEGNRRMQPAPHLDTSRVPVSVRRLLAATFDVHGIGFYSGLQVGQFHYLDRHATNKQVADGADNVWLVDENGKQLYYYRYHRSICCQNWTHPAYRRELTGLLEDHLRTFAHLEHYRGVHMLYGPIIIPMYYPAFIKPRDFARPFFASYDDTSFAQFEAETGVKVRGAEDAPDRFQRRAAFVRENPSARETFRQWRCNKFHEIISDGLEVLRRHRDDLSLFGVMATAEPGLFQAWLESGRSAEDFLKDFGHDLSLFKGANGMCLGRWTLGWRQSKEAPYKWLARESEPYARAFMDPNGPNYVMVRTSWIESRWHYESGEVYGDFGYPKLVDGYDWVVKRTSQLTVHPNFAGFHCREAFIQAIITADPNILVTGFTDHALPLGHHDKLRPLMAVFTSLPQGHFEPVLDTGLTSNLAIRKREESDHAVFYVANPAFWQVKGSLRLRTEGPVRELMSGKAVELSPAEDGVRRLAVDLEPYGMTAFRVEAPPIDVVGYTVDAPAPEALAYVSSLGTQVADLMKNEKAAAALEAPDRAYLQDVLGHADKALQQSLYAEAWYTLKQPRFRTLWRDVLEPAAR